DNRAMKSILYLYINGKRVIVKIYPWAVHPPRRPIYLISFYCWRAKILMMIERDHISEAGSIPATSTITRGVRIGCVLAPVRPAPYGGAPVSTGCVDRSGVNRQATTLTARTIKFMPKQRDF